MGRGKITKEKIIYSYLTSASEKSPGAISLTDVSSALNVNKASLYNYFSSREDIYNATLEYCEKGILNVAFVSDAIRESAKSSEINAISIFGKIITQYFKLYESDPFFKIYAFVHSEQYFNRRAMEIVSAENKRIADETKMLLKILKDNGKCTPEENDLKNISNSFIALFFAQLDCYIAQKMEIIRQNPDSGVGSLFALPTDETMLEKRVKIITDYLETVL